MKPVKFILSSALLVTAIATYSQDTTGVTTPPAPVEQDVTSPQNQVQQDQVQQDQANFKKDMIIIPATEIPASLRGTLQGTQYKGWENGTIYRNQSSDMFMVEVREGNQTKTYRFDQNGKAVKDF